MGRKLTNQAHGVAALTPELIVDAALEFIDHNGAGALTIRALGQKLGAHHTALYRHFPSKENLETAVYGRVIQDAIVRMGELPADPVERLRTMAFSLRAAFREHPAVISIINGASDTQAADALQAEVLSCLRALKVPESKLASVYQILESFAFGITLYDFGGAPDHAKLRHRRLSRAADKALVKASKDLDTVAKNVEAAYEAGFELILSGLKAGRF